MTTIESAAPAATAAPAAPVGPAHASAGLRVRRHALIALPVLAGALVTIAAAADPAAGISGERMYAIYAEHPDALQLKSLAYKWGYAFWIGTALLVAALVRGRGVWLANAGAVLGFGGMTTLPGMLFGDWVDSAAGQLWGAEGATALHERMEEISWGMPFFTLPGIVGLALALPLAAAGLWRAGRVRWWALAAVVAAFVAFMASMATWPGCLIATSCLAAFSAELARGTREPRERAAA